MPSAIKHHFLSELLMWSSSNFVQIYFNKTKEITLGPVARHDLDPLVISGNNIEHVFNFKLFVVHIYSDLRWNMHIDALPKRVNSRLYRLKQIKRSVQPEQDLLIFNTTVIRPVLEHAANVLSLKPNQIALKCSKNGLCVQFSLLHKRCRLVSLSIHGLVTLTGRLVISINRNAVPVAKKGTGTVFPILTLHSPHFSPSSASYLPIPNHTHTHCYCSFINYALTNY
jgi:hypothetical protein